MTSLLGEMRMMQIGDLVLDPQNPRLPASIQGKSQIDLAIALDMGFDAFTVAESMSEHGYFSSEPMIAIPSEVTDQWIVVEGNRRLTAILGLTDRSVRTQFIDAEKWTVIAQDAKIKATDKIPVVIAESRISVVPVIGFRHISGILAWKPYPQARYVATLIDKNRFTPQEVSTMIGLPKNAVCDLYREQAIAEQAKNVGVKTGNLESAFSLLTVAMRNSKLREHVGAPLSSQFEPGTQPIPNEKISELKELLRYIFGGDGKEPVISDSRQITSLANVMSNPAGLAALRDSRSLDEAKQRIASSGLSPYERLTNRLTAGKSALIAAAEDVAGYEKDPNVLILLDEILSAVETLQAAVEDIND